ncbi:hypothetical protein QFC20_005728 [Naganishia adeliensis]|uniref:Uncharacterized protein n=1 Tax=Naganishia adeliensis TaxID=92952 RepID=A0ACC2VKG0_9TREE|nr:hypothetical protein QFC20_005728 [Naganishia adeliensis]
MATIDADSAVAITAEFFASLDNVKDEVAFLLEEIRSRDHLILEHLRKAESRGNTLYRTTRVPHTTPTTLTPSLPRDNQAHTRILTEYTRIDTLQDEKTTLALKLQRIITRHRERARDEWRRIVGDEAAAAFDAQQEDAEGVSGVAWAVSRVEPEGSVAAAVAGLMRTVGSGGGTPVEERVVKKRKSSHAPPTTSYFDVPAPSITRTSPHPLATAFTPTTTKDTRKRTTTAQVSTPDAAPTPPAVEEELQALEGDATDDTLYCFCQEKSHGEMIGCDNETCRFEWFHVKCMKLDPDKLPEHWFCPECVKLLGFSSSTGEKESSGGGYKKTKGRKK